MDRIERWKLADELTAYQIALLIGGYDPSEFEDKPESWPREVLQDILPFLTAVKNAARAQRIKCTRVMQEDGYGGTGDISWTYTTIDVLSLCAWLNARNYTDGFFVGGQGEVDVVADQAGENYAPKLAAAIRAWNEVTADAEALNGKTPKKALEVWLRKHANEYGLSNKDGNPNELGIEEICKVANWKPAGGASPTPSVTPTPRVGSSTWVRKVRPNPPTPFRQRLISQAQPVAKEIDDDIPF